MSDIHSFTPLWGTWEIDDLIGQGSHGKVYRAHRVEYGQSKTYYSAIKHISIPQDKNEAESLYSDGIVNDPSSLNAYYENVLKRLLREIDINVSLKGHTNIVSYEDHMVVPKKDGPGYDIFIRMELLTPLPKVLQQRAITENEVRKLGIDMCSALEVMSSRNILHRDIKPSNIFVSDSGEFKLGDFGVSRSLDSANGGVTIAGTLNYMAPELNRGQSVSFRSDIYSLGLVLYRLCNANRPPFVELPPAPVTADDIENSNGMRFSGRPLPAPAYASPALGAIILRACRFSPEERFVTASEMKQALIGGPVYSGQDTGAYQNEKTVSAYSEGYNNNFSSYSSYDNQNSNKKTNSSNKTLIIVLIGICAMLLIALVAAFALRGCEAPDEEPDDDIVANTDLPQETPEPDDSVISPSKPVSTPRPVATSTPVPEPVYETLVDEYELGRLLDSYAPYSEASVFISDVTRGMQYSAGNAYSKSISSALINIPIMLTVMYDVDNGFMRMSDEVYFDYQLNGRGYLSSANDGDFIQISTLMYAMLSYSDNNAANSLMEYLGYGHIEDVCSYYGFDSVVVNAKIGFTSSSNENYVSAADVAGMLELIWNGEFAGGRDYLRNNMYIIDSTAGSGIGAGISGDYGYMNHNGVRSNLYNEAAIVDNGEETYIIVCMCCGDTQSQLMSCASMVSSYVHSCLK